MPRRAAALRTSALTPARVNWSLHARVIDLDRRRLLPGFQDSHVPPADAPNPASTLDPHGTRERGQVFERRRELAWTHPEIPAENRALIGEWSDHPRASLRTARAAASVLLNVMPELVRDQFAVARSG
jgi:predicted amidohydrolase YtcJ